MNLMKTHEFDFEGKHYEVRVTTNGEDIEIQTFLHGTPANGYLYCVRFPTRFSIMNKFGSDAVDELIQQAETDVRTKVWERYVKAFREKQKEEAK